MRKTRHKSDKLSGRDLLHVVACLIASLALAYLVVGVAHLVCYLCFGGCFT